jgi:hypothetical protein
VNQTIAKQRWLSLIPIAFISKGLPLPETMEQSEK